MDKREKVIKGKLTELSLANISLQKPDEQISPITLLGGTKLKVYFNDLIWPEVFSTDDEPDAVYKRSDAYERWKKEFGLMDSNDLL